jgi:ubiquinone biosynthesis protein Coq4
MSQYLIVANREDPMVSSAAPVHYAYGAKPTRNPFRFLLAMWRLVRDPANTHEAAIVELAFARSRIGRRFARWHEVVDALRRDPRTAPALQRRQHCQPIDLEALARMPEGTLGRVFAAHCRARSLNPNLVNIPPDSEIDWMLHHLYLTHDIWHVVTGWGNDEIGEYGLGSFYSAQLAGASFFGFLFSVAALSTVLRRRSFRDFLEAAVAGYESGKRAEPLFGVDWRDLWETPIGVVRARVGIEAGQVSGEGIRAAACTGSAAVHRTAKSRYRSGTSPRTCSPR